MMNFFEQQREAWRQIALLLILFLAASALQALFAWLAILLGAWLTVCLAISPSLDWLAWLWSWFTRPFIAIPLSLTIIALILNGALLGMQRLRRHGGQSVAHILNARPVREENATALERKLLNIASEMAIASGLPMPRVYLMDTPAINALAAGFAPEDAVLIVTRMALETMRRNELEAIIAHEFSHFQNQDALLKMWLLGVLSGISAIPETGRFLAAPIDDDDRSRRSFLAIIGFAMIAVGSVGLIAPQLIKRAILRQREFRADAAAVQFTRDPEGVVNALKLIAAAGGGRIRHRYILRAEHFFFADPVARRSTSSLLATHPSIEERIQRLPPSFRGPIPPLNHAEFEQRLRANGVTEQ